MSSKPRTQTSESSVPYEPFVFENLGAAGTLQPGAVSPDFEKNLYEKGLAEGEARARATLEKTLAETRGEVTEVLRQFTVERETYFQRVESEIVQLSLSIARKILHREAQMDPLLLTGIVRVAPGQFERRHTGSTAAPTLRRSRPGAKSSASLRHRPRSGAESAMHSAAALGHCVLETDVGEIARRSACLETQLKEIEQGFPGSARPASPGK